jgi:hypothetical protein
MNETELPPSSSSDILASRTDTVVAALANHRRRAILTYLQQAQSGTATVEELASFIAEHADGQSSTPLDTDGQNITMSLHHVHLPKLADANLITYEPDRGRVSDQSDGWVADLLATIENG